MNTFFLVFIPHLLFKIMPLNDRRLFTWYHGWYSISFTLEFQDGIEINSVRYISIGGGIININEKEFIRLNDPMK